MIKIIAVGKVKETSLQELINEYQKRISGFDKVEIIEVKEESINKNASELDQLKIIEKESQRIIDKIDKNAYVIAMDIKGKMIDSIEFSKMIDDIHTYQNANINFVIGGSLGLSDEIKRIANERISISKMTFPHQLFRLILLEQVYRAFKILHHEPYHK